MYSRSNYKSYINVFITRLELEFEQAHQNALYSFNTSFNPK